MLSQQIIYQRYITIMVTLNLLSIFDLSTHHAAVTDNNLRLQFFIYNEPENLFNFFSNNFCGWAVWSEKTVHGMSSFEQMHSGL